MKKYHRTAVLKAARKAERHLHYFEEKSKDKRPRKAIEDARAWTRGEIKCGEARKAALNAHAAARKTSNLVARYAARAAGHAAATCHVPTHIVGVDYYLGKLKDELKKEK